MKELKLVERISANDGGRLEYWNKYEISEYTVNEVITIFTDGRISTNFYIEETNRGANPYNATIYYDKRFGAEVGTFKIQTTAYGALEASEFADFIKAQQEALEVAEVLTKTFNK